MSVILLKIEYANYYTRAEHIVHVFAACFWKQNNFQKFVHHFMKFYRIRI